MDPHSHITETDIGLESTTIHPVRETASATSSVEVVTLGCRLNAYESDVMASHARDEGLTNTVIINSCAVTNAAVADTRHAIRKARRDHPSAKIIVTGCAVQIDPDSFAAMTEVDHVMGNAEKMLSQSFAPEPLSERVRVNDIMAVTETAPQFLGGGNRPDDKLQARTRAFLQVQNGCDHRCTFCIIPYGRGQARSVPAGEVVRHVAELVAQGHKEVVLTGVDISSWGQDLPGTPPLGNLVQRVLKLVPELPRLRLSSIDPAEIDTQLKTVIAEEPRFMPYLHLSIQSGDDMILKRMKRRHTSADLRNICKELRALRPGMTFGGDIIAGFTTETDAMHANTMTLLEEIGVPWLHVFPYSAREGTPAAKMPAVDGAMIKARAKALRTLARKMKAAHIASRVGQTDIALFEEGGIGRLPDFTTVKLDTSPPARTSHTLTLTGQSGDHATALLSPNTT